MHQRSRLNASSQMQGLKRRSYNIQAIFSSQYETMRALCGKAIMTTRCAMEIGTPETIDVFKVHYFSIASLLLRCENHAAT